MLRTLVTDYQYIHLTIGILGNSLFFVGSVLFFDQFKSLHTLAVWLFTLGSGGMLVGALGKAAKDIYEAEKNDGAS